jgi:hypothetical protein
MRRVQTSSSSAPPARPSLLGLWTACWRNPASSQDLNASLPPGTFRWKATSPRTLFRPSIVRPTVPTSVFFLVFFGGPLAVSGCIGNPSSYSSSTLAGMNRFENPRVGYSLLYPAAWQVRGQIVATEFARLAHCESVEIVDFQPSADSGPAAFVLHSFVQICSQPLTDALSLDDFMRQTYGGALAAQFQVTELDGLRAYRAMRAPGETTIFLQTNRYRIQIASSVNTHPHNERERVSQVQQVLDSFAIVGPKATPGKGP